MQVQGPGPTQPYGDDSSRAMDDMQKEMEDAMKQAQQAAADLATQKAHLEWTQKLDGKIDQFFEASDDCRKGRMSLGEVEKIYNEFMNLYQQGPNQGPGQTAVSNQVPPQDPPPWMNV